eukprot:scaffold150298_cov18-Tisochrysis_lutea.AAC.1
MKIYDDVLAGIPTRVPTQAITPGCQADDRQPPYCRSYSAYAFKAFEAYLPGLLVRLEHQKKGMNATQAPLEDLISVQLVHAPHAPQGQMCSLSMHGMLVKVPCLVLAGLFSLILMISVVRAAASARSAHAGPLCVLSKLGINVGPAGCGGRVASEVRVWRNASASTWWRVFRRALEEC